MPTKKKFFNKSAYIVGTNVNQIAKALNTYKNGELRKRELQVIEELIVLYRQILDKIQDIRL